MVLTLENKKIITDWLDAKCGPMRCTCCGHSAWAVIDISTLQIGFDIDTTRFHYHGGLPIVSIACNNCGHIVQFNPAVMGIKPVPVPEAKVE